MALQSGAFLQDENNSVHYMGPSFAKANAMNSQGKGGPSGRKPLGDLSNSRKIVLNQASKLKTPMNLTSIGEGKKKKVVKGSKRVRIGIRKVLSDISNAGKPNQEEASKKKVNLKIDTVAENPLHHSTIYEEGFLHNHDECIKVLNRAMDMDEFLKLVGLDAPIKFTSPKKPNSPLNRLEFPDIDELLKMDESADEPPFIYQFPKKLQPDSPPCMSPESPSQDFLSLWKDRCDVNFTLRKSP